MKLKNILMVASVCGMLTVAGSGWAYSGVFLPRTSNYQPTLGGGMSGSSMKNSATRLSATGNGAVYNMGTPTGSFGSRRTSLTNNINHTGAGGFSNRLDGANSNHRFTGSNFGGAGINMTSPNVGGSIGGGVPAYSFSMPSNSLTNRVNQSRVGHSSQQNTTPVYSALSTQYGSSPGGFGDLGTSMKSIAFSPTIANQNSGGVQMSGLDRSGVGVTTNEPNMNYTNINQ